jgi:tripartite-type tricarboxylate transporter receptor subunit TctC
MKSRLVSLLGLLAVIPLLAPAWAQERYPSRPVEFIVPFGPGGGADQLARKMARLLEAELKVSVPAVNVPGATGGTGMAKLVATAPDGYSIAVYIADTHALLATTANPRWKNEDLVPLGIMMRQPSALFVKADSPWKTWRDVAKAAKASPGKLKVAVVGLGSVDEMALKYMEGKGMKFTAVPYAKPGERYTAILGGHADLLYEQPGDVRSFLDSNQMRAILMFNQERVPEFGDVVSSKEVGIEIYLPQFRSVVVRAGTDPQRVKILAAAVARVAADPEYYAFLKESLALRDSFIPAAQAKKFLDGELAVMEKFAAQLKQH